MAVATTPRGYIERPRPSGLADVVEVILDKGLVIDAFVRVSLIGIEILTIDARIVIASVDTYLRFGEAVNRMDIVHDSDSQGLPEPMESITEGGAKSKVKGLAEGAKDASRATTTTNTTSRRAATTKATSPRAAAAGHPRGGAHPRRARGPGRAACKRPTPEEPASTPRSRGGSTPIRQR